MLKLLMKKEKKKIHLKTVIERNGLLFIVHLFSDLLGFHLWYFHYGIPNVIKYLYTAPRHKGIVRSPFDRFSLYLNKASSVSF